MWFVELAPEFGVSLRVRYYPTQPCPYVYRKSDQIRQALWPRPENILIRLTPFLSDKPRYFKSLLRVFFFLTESTIKPPVNLTRAFRVYRIRRNPRNSRNHHKKTHYVVQRPHLHAPHLYCPEVPPSVRRQNPHRDPYLVRQNIQWENKTYKVRTPHEILCPPKTKKSFFPPSKL